MERMWYVTVSCSVSSAHYSLHSPRHGSRLAYRRAGESERQGASYVPGAAKLNPQTQTHTHAQTGSCTWEDAEGPFQTQFQCIPAVVRFVGGKLVCGNIMENLHEQNYWNRPEHSGTSWIFCVSLVQLIYSYPIKMSASKIQQKYKYTVECKCNAEASYFWSASHNTRVFADQIYSSEFDQHCRFCVSKTDIYDKYLNCNLKIKEYVIPSEFEN